MRNVIGGFNRHQFKDFNKYLHVLKLTVYAGKKTENTSLINKKNCLYESNMHNQAHLLYVD